MDYDTFVGEVQNRAQLPTREDAVGIIRITLKTFSERLEPGAADNLSAQLPNEIGRHLSKVDEVEQFGWEEFVDRIVERGEYADDEAATAVHHARSVMDVVEEAVTAGALNDVRDQLPDDEDFEELFVLADQEEKPVEEEQRPEDQRS